VRRSPAPASRCSASDSPTASTRNGHRRTSPMRSAPGTTAAAGGRSPASGARRRMDQRQVQRPRVPVADHGRLRVPPLLRLGERNDRPNLRCARPALAARGTPPLWWTESGFDTESRHGSYFGVSVGIVRCSHGSEAEQAVRVQQVMQEARTSAHVAGAFNFLLYDELDLSRWHPGSCGPTARRSRPSVRSPAPSVRR
jgi:hypothetical protein